MGKNQKSGGGLGQALIRQRAQTTRLPGRMYGAEKPLESITDVKDLDEVMEQAERAGRVFSALHPLPELLLNQQDAEDEMLSPYEKEQQRQAEEAIYEASLTVPRRPAWEVGMTAEQLDVQERQAFLTWRRGFARLEENEKLIITPFEKNIAIWRQLWRVLERSDLVIMVVDCRNPLFYRCPDLEAYVQELDPHKRTMLLLNKADLLPASLRKTWADYFRAKEISYLFWSAKAATAALEGKLENLGLDLTDRDKDVEILSREDLLDRLQSEAEMIARTRKDAARAALAQHIGKEDSQPVQDGAVRDESILRVAHGTSTSGGDSRRVVVGFVGYPNVGKSSTINALVGGKKTGVTSTPGKTKHFQTLIINEKLMLCDCPGLVFPSFSSSRSEMVASGVLPIDRITDQRGPIEVVAKRVSRETLEKVYGLRLPVPKPYERQDRPPTASELLRAYAQSRGLVASSGLPDETRAARQILKDYSNGKLFHCCLPPTEAIASNHVERNTSMAPGPSKDPEESVAAVSGNEGVSGADSDESDDDIIELDSVSGSRRLGVPASTSGKLLGLAPGASEHASLQDIFTDLDNVGGTFGGSTLTGSTQKQKSSTSHKMHRKAPRVKDRSWRVQNDGSDGMSLVRGVQKPVSHGAGPLQQVVM